MSKLVWQYEGANQEKHGEQCLLVGDKVHHDILGEGIAVRIDGGMIIIEFLEDGERIEKHQTKGHVYALEQRERAQQKRTGRPGWPPRFIVWKRTRGSCRCRGGAEATAPWPHTTHSAITVH